jgi:hypothetical protein
MTADMWFFSLTLLRGCPEHGVYRLVYARPRADMWLRESVLGATGANDVACASIVLLLTMAKVIRRAAADIVR